MAVTNFEEITHELTTQEIRIAKYLASDYFPFKDSSKKAVVNSQIEAHIKYIAGKNEIVLKHRYTAARIRKIINYIRINGLCDCLLATSNGYYVSTDQLEIEKYLLSLKERINSITMVYDSIEHQFINLNNGTPRPEIK